MRKQTLNLSVLACLLLVLLTPAVQAHTATQFFDVKIAELPEEGSAEDVKWVRRLRNLFVEDRFLVSLR